MSFSSNEWEKQGETTASEPYHYVRPDSGRENYQDANYIQTAPSASGKHTAAPKKKNSAVRIFALCLICVLVGTAIGVAFGGNLFGNDTAGEPGHENPALTAETAPAPAETNTPVLSVANREDGVMDASDIYDQACGQVVGITTEITYTNYFGMNSSSAVTGSGFILTEDGYILTNYHVIEYAVSGGYTVSVVLYDGTEYTAEIVGYEDDESDIAVLKIEAEGLTAATMGDSSEMRVGDTVYAVGNPLGELHYTMTRGMVSALDREISSQDSQTREIKTVNMFQIDAAVNSGNSGGPVYDEAGRVIGVVTAKYSDSGVEGLGFAIPIADAIDIANDLITQGYVSGKPSLGVYVDTIGAATANYYRLVEGAYVYAIEPDSCAERAGLELGDIITKLDDIEITGSSSLRSAKKNYRAGDTAVLTIYRDGAYMKCTIVFDEETGSALQTGGQTNG
ncbi:MAG: trypsin-like peptidase domain-containing protein [Eubacteriales bacterium]|nr:trypsin-like peptidase domain-containing protein [Eubacteriales bacterium]